MVAQKRGRGAKAQAAKAKAAVAEEPVQEPEVAEAAEAAEESNGQSEAAEAGGGEPAPAADADADAQPEAQPQEGEGEGDAKPEEKKEEKVESGKILVENLPSSYLFDYQEKLKELFSKHGEVTTVKRGPIIVTELTTTPTLSAIVEFKNKDSLEKALTEEGTVLDGHPISVAVESRAETAVLVGVPYEAQTDYVRLLFAQCGEVAHIHEFSKTKYKILRVTFHSTDAVERALKLDRELRINGFLVTVSKYRDDDDHKQAHNVNKNKRQHPQNQNRNNNQNQNVGGGGGGGGGAAGAGASPNNNRQNNFRARGGGAAFNSRGNFRGSRGRGGFGGRGGAFPRGGFAPVNAYMPPQGFMGRPGGFMNDGQRPNKRLRQM